VHHHVYVPSTAHRSTLVGHNCRLRHNRPEHPNRPNHWWFWHHRDCTQVATVISQRSLTVGRCRRCVVCLSGVPQGSALGPLLFALYISPVANVVKGHNLCQHHYTDDTQLYMAVIPNDGGSWHAISSCVDDVCRWFLENGLLLNPAKTEAIQRGRSWCCWVGDVISWSRQAALCYAWCELDHGSPCHRGHIPHTGTAAYSTTSYTWSCQDFRNLTALLQLNSTTVTLCYVQRQSETSTDCRLLTANWRAQSAVLRGPPVPLSSDVSCIVWQLQAGTVDVQDEIYRHSCIPGVSTGKSQAGSNAAIF